MFISIERKFSIKYIHEEKESSNFCREFSERARTIRMENELFRIRASSNRRDKQVDSPCTYLETRGNCVFDFDALGDAFTRRNRNFSRDFTWKDKNRNARE